MADDGQPISVPFFDKDGATLGDVPQAYVSQALKDGRIPAVPMKHPKYGAVFVPATKLAQAKKDGFIYDAPTDHLKAKAPFADINLKEAGLALTSSFGFPETNSPSKNITGLVKNVAQGGSIALRAISGDPFAGRQLAEGIAATVKNTAKQLGSQDMTEFSRGLGTSAGIIGQLAMMDPGYRAALTDVSNLSNKAATATSEAMRGSAAKLMNKFGVLPESAFDLGKNPGSRVAQMANLFTGSFKKFSAKIDSAAQAIENTRTQMLGIANTNGLTIDASKALQPLMETLSKASQMPASMRPYITKVVSAVKDLAGHPLQALPVGAADDLLKILQSPASYATGTPAEFAKVMRKVHHEVALAVDKQIPGYLDIARSEAEMIDYLDGVNGRAIDDLKGEFFDPTRPFKAKYEAGISAAGNMVVKPLQGLVSHLPAIHTIWKIWNSTPSVTGRAALLRSMANVTERLAQPLFGGSKGGAGAAAAGATGGEGPTPNAPAPQAPAPRAAAAPAGAGANAVMKQAVQAATQRTGTQAALATPAATPPQQSAVAAAAVKAAQAAAKLEVSPSASALPEAAAKQVPTNTADAWTAFDEAKAARQRGTPKPAAASPSPTTATPKPAASDTPKVRAQVHTGHHMGRTGIIVGEDGNKLRMVFKDIGKVEMNTNDVTKLKAGDKANNALRMRGDRERMSGVVNPEAPKAAGVGTGEEGSKLEQVAGAEHSAEDYIFALETGLEYLDGPETAKIFGKNAGQAKIIAKTIQDLRKGGVDAKTLLEHMNQAIEQMQQGPPKE